MALVAFAALPASRTAVRSCAVIGAVGAVPHARHTELHVDDTASVDPSASSSKAFPIVEVTTVASSKDRL